MHPGLLFEAGALAKNHNDIPKHPPQGDARQHSAMHVCTYLLDLKKEDVPPPLGLFQHTSCTAADTRHLVHTINRDTAETVPTVRLDSIFDALWPRFQNMLDSIPEPKQAVQVKRGQEDILAEVLDLVRSQAQAGSQSRSDVDIERVMGRLDLLDINVALAALGGRKSLGLLAETSQNARIVCSFQPGPTRTEHIKLMIDDLWKTIGTKGDIFDPEEPPKLRSL